MEVEAGRGQPSAWHLGLLGTVIVGVAAMVTGLVWDTRAHHADATLATREGPPSLSHSSHAMVAVGLVLAAAGAVGAALTAPRPLSGSRRPWLGIGALAAAVLTLGSTATVAGLGGGDGAAEDLAAHQPRDYARLRASASEDQRRAADELLASTRAELAGYGDVNAARAAGFVPNSNPPLRSVHYFRKPNRDDGVLLDPRHPEGLVYWHADDGRKVLMAAIFMARPEDRAGPTPAGRLAPWHSHTEGCHLPDYDRGCAQRALPRMLHVWVFPGAVDPFAVNLLQANGGELPR